MNTNGQNISTGRILTNLFLDFIFPPTCIGCRCLIDKAEYRNEVSRPGICNKCKDTIVIQNSFSCAFCQAAVVNGMTCPFCRRDHELNQLLVAVSYEQPLVKSAIKNFKYKFMRGLSKDLSSIMTGYLKKQLARGVVSLSNTIIVPVPLSASRLRWRGFNQAELLAQELGRSFNLPVMNTLERTGNRKNQADIKDRETRVENMKNSFICIDPKTIIGKDILLIDDISTTGSTLEACSQALKKAKASRVVGFVFARN